MSSPPRYAFSASARAEWPGRVPATPSAREASEAVTRKPPLNECGACGRDFGSLGAFDQHRVGKYPQTGPAEYRDRLARGLVPDDEDWRPELGRRCLDESELRERGFTLDKHGRWRRPASGRAPWSRS